jgi:hypothetical protein
MSFKIETEIIYLNKVKKKNMKAKIRTLPLKVSYQLIMAFTCVKYSQFTLRFISKFCSVKINM